MKSASCWFHHTDVVQVVRTILQFLLDELLLDKKKLTQCIRSLMLHTYTVSNAQMLSIFKT
jgi:hypothetical protein